MMMLLFHVTPRVLKLKISLGMRLGLRAYVPSGLDVGTVEAGEKVDVIGADKR